MYYVLYYHTVENYDEKKIPFRQMHFAYATAALDRGELVMGGAFAEPADGALLVFNVEDPNTVIEFAKNDPYVINGLISDWNVRGWNVVIGD